MQAEIIDRVSCAQKLNQPIRLQASDAFARAFLATSETAELVLRGSSSDDVFALVTVACAPLPQLHTRLRPVLWTACYCKYTAGL